MSFNIFEQKKKKKKKHCRPPSCSLRSPCCSGNAARSSIPSGAFEPSHSPRPKPRRRRLAVAWLKVVGLAMVQKRFLYIHNKTGFFMFLLQRLHISWVFWKSLEAERLFVLFFLMLACWELLLVLGQAAGPRRRQAQRAARSCSAIAAALGPLGRFLCG